MGVMEGWMDVNHSLIGLSTFPLHTLILNKNIELQYKIYIFHCLLLLLVYIIQNHGRRYFELHHY